MAKPDLSMLTKKYKGLPVWLWVLIALALFAVVRSVLKRRQVAAEAAGDEAVSEYVPTPAIPDSTNGGEMSFDDWELLLSGVADLQDDIAELGAESGDNLSTAEGNIIDAVEQEGLDLGGLLEEIKGEIIEAGSGNPPPTYINIGPIRGIKEGPRNGGKDGKGGKGKGKGKKKGGRPLVTDAKQAKALSNNVTYGGLVPTVPPQGRVDIGAILSTRSAKGKDVASPQKETKHQPVPPKIPIKEAPPRIQGRRTIPVRHSPMQSGIKRPAERRR